MNIWFISIFEQTPLDQVYSTRFQSVIREAVHRGHDVTFFSSTFKHNTKEQRFEDTTVKTIEDRYKVVYITSLPYRKNISVSRIRSHFKFAFVALHEVKKYAKPDIIILAYPPIVLSKLITSWAKKNDIPVVLDVIDPWPDNFVLAAPKRLRFVVKPVFAPLRYIFAKTLKHIDALTSISNEYVQWAHKIYSSIPQKQVFYPAADFKTQYEKITEYRKGKSSNGFTVIYAGSLGLMYDVDCILRAAEILHDEYPEIKFTIAGAGEQKRKIEEYATRYSNILYLGRLSKNDLLKAYAEADLGCTQHIKGATQTVTYKLFDLLSCGLPVLNSLESEMKDIIIDNQVGLHNNPGDAKQLVANILYFYKNPEVYKKYVRNGLKLTKSTGDSEVVYKKFVDLLERTSHRTEDIHEYSVNEGGN